MVFLRSILCSAKRVPLIKFRKGGPMDPVSPSQATTGGATGAAATGAPAQTRSASSGEAIEDWQLPARYRRLPMSDVEMEWINRGGPPA